MKIFLIITGISLAMSAQAQYIPIVDVQQVQVESELYLDKDSGLRRKDNVIYLDMDGGDIIHNKTHAQRAAEQDALELDYLIALGISAGKNNKLYLSAYDATTLNQNLFHCPISKTHYVYNRYSPHEKQKFCDYKGREFKYPILYFCLKNTLNISIISYLCDDRMLLIGPEKERWQKIFAINRNDKEDTQYLEELFSFKGNSTLAKSHFFLDQNQQKTLNNLRFSSTIED